MLTPRSNAPMPAASPLDTSPRESGANERPEVEDRLVNQRRALEEMSQRLLNEFNNMVLLQEERARKFVAHSHSLSSLPQVLPAVAAEAKAAVAEAVKRREPELPTPPPLAVETTSPEREIYTSSRRLRTSPEEKEPPKEQSRFGFWSMIFIWILIILAIRTCS